MVLLTYLEPQGLWWVRFIGFALVLLSSHCQGLSWHVESLCRFQALLQTAALALSPLGCKPPAPQTFDLSLPGNKAVWWSLAEICCELEICNVVIFSPDMWTAMMAKQTARNPGSRSPVSKCQASTPTLDPWEVISKPPRAFRDVSLWSTFHACANHGQQTRVWLPTSLLTSSGFRGSGKAQPDGQT